MKTDDEIVCEVFDAYRAPNDISNPPESAFVRAGRLAVLREVVEQFPSCQSDNDGCEEFFGWSQPQDWCPYCWATAQLEGE